MPIASPDALNLIAVLTDAFNEAEQETAAVLTPDAGDGFLLDDLWLQAGKFLRDAGGARRAEFCDRTDQALRRGSRACDRRRRCSSRGFLARSSRRSWPSVSGRSAHFPDSGRFLPPDTTFYFSNELLPGNEFKLIDMKQAPEWR